MIQPGFTHHLSSRDILEFEINISNESLILKQCINISPGKQFFFNLMKFKVVETSYIGTFVVPTCVMCVCL